MDNVVFTGGGTGGHIFPGIAVAEVFLEKNDCKIIWIGSSKGMDKNIVESAGLDFISIPTGKLRRYFSLRNFIDVFKVIAGVIKSILLLSKIKPKFVFSKGGFVSVPPCVAAKFLKIPVITHECDFSPGLATKLNSRFAIHILTSYPETINFLNSKVQAKAVCTGNPVRLSFYSADIDKGKEFLNIRNKKELNLIDTHSNFPVLFVLGGSLGAKKLNDLIEDSIEYLIEKFIVVHQIGKENIEQIDKIRNKISEYNPKLIEKYKAYPFLNEEMSIILAASSIVVSRAGANTVWEATAAGKPMILIPLEKGTSRGDQLENAEFFRRNGAAEVLTGKFVNAKKLQEILDRLFADNEKLLKIMAENSVSLAKNKPALIISDFLSKFLNEENS